MRVRLDRSASTLTITGAGLSGVLLLGAVLAVLLLVTVPRAPAEEEVAGLVRHYLRYQLGQWYAGLYRRGRIGADASRRYQEELGRIDELSFESIRVGRLLPDYLFARQPTFYARVVIRDGNGERQTRYFNLGRGSLVMAESSEVAWLFVF